MPQPVPRRQALLPNPPEHVSTESFAGAIQRATRAVATAEEAFHTRGSHSTPVIDLTGSPPRETSEGRRRYSRAPGGATPAEFISTTTHPHDNHRSHRLASFLNDPVYGYVDTPPQTLPPIWDSSEIDSLDRARNQRAQLFQRRARQLLHSRRHTTAREEESAVRRQQQNRIAWQQTQARLRRLQQNILAQDLDPGPLPEPELSLSSSSDEGTASDSEGSDLFSGDPVSPAMSANANIESIDLTNVDNSSEVAKVLSKQRTEAILSQRPAGATEEGRTPFTAFKCPICMESLTNATVTKCGHIFCHKCIIDTLKWSSQQSRDEHPGRKAHPGHCPVCRTSLLIKDAKGSGRTLIPLHLKELTAKDIKGKRRADSADIPEASASKKQKRGRGRPTKAPVERSFKRETTAEIFGYYIDERED